MTDTDVAARTVPGPTALAGQLLAAGAVQRADLDPATRARVTAAFGDLLPGQPLGAGAAGADRHLPPDALATLVPSAAVVAAGLDPATTPLPVPPVIWRSGRNELLVHVGDVKADVSDGLIQITVPVTCDQTEDAEVTVTFATGTADRPAGGIATTEDHPRGPDVVVENWAEPLVAFAWQTLVTATSALAGAGGGDRAGHPLVTAALTVSPDGLAITPMGRHSFAAPV